MDRRDVVLFRSVSRAGATVGAETDLSPPAEGPGVVEQAKTTSNTLIYALGIGFAGWLVLKHVAPAALGAASHTKRAMRGYHEAWPEARVEKARRQLELERVNIERREIAKRERDRLEHENRARPQIATPKRSFIDAEFEEDDAPLANNYGYVYSR